MSAELSLIEEGSQKKAVKALWLVEAKARTDLSEARGLVEAATRLRDSHDRRVRKDAESLQAYGEGYIARLDRPAAALPTDTGGAIAQEDEAVDVTPLSLGITLLGGGVMLLAVFLPQFESNSFARIEKNSLIQNGDGWWFIVLAVLAAGAAYRAYRWQRRSFASVVFGAIGIAVAIYYGTSHSQRRLCSLDPSTFGQNCTLATPGIGIYAAGVGGLLVLIGGWQIFRSSAPDTEDTDEPVQALATGDRVMPPTIAERLRTLEKLLAGDLITDAEYAERRAALIAEV